MSVSNTINWIDEIAAKSRVERDEVTKILLSHGIEEDSTLPRKRSLTLKRVLFRGIKHGEEDPFEFLWDGLGNGIWGLLTDDNGKGKSSILGLVRGALRGELPGSRLKPDVWGWLSEFELDFLIDEHIHRICLMKPAGATEAAAAVATLSRFDNGRELVIKRGIPDDAFGKAVDSLFMDELGFSRVRAYRARQGEAAEHGWPAMCAALFITGPGDTLFGDTAQDAIHLRLIQLFIGLPWITTYTCASTGLKAVSARLAKETTGKSDRVVSRIRELEDQIQELEIKLKDEPDLTKLRSDLPSLDQELVELRQIAEDAGALVLKRNALYDDAKIARAEARRRLLQAKDDAEARVVFKRLKPTCCPSCAREFEKNRFAATEAPACGLCGKEEDEVGSTEELITELEAEAADTLESQKTAEKAVDEAKIAWEKASAAVTAASQRISKVQAELRKGSAAEEIRLDIAKLKARIEELELATGPSVDVDLIRREEAVLKAAEKVTKSLFEDLQTEILTEVSGALMKFSEAFGVRNLQSMTLNGAGHLKIEQGGQITSFTKLNAGENLRVRIAAALAVLEVAERRGHGRHPGLIVLDSPAAQEMSHQDFAALVESVVTAVDEFPNVQIVVGAVNRQELISRVPRERRRHAEGANPLF
ncbi:hypothetical protein PHLH8_19970 [Pseudomonas sp. Pc102]|uniref:hypothetical protein n=1 Tax=Pseudomonas sp. Pc102 TaxID=2678261 RepID=UPI001BCB43C8|nr:hypothetical protein [Pseudomonas sp. Pc102]BBP82355.1 hypothetical protein PHLH8_19970 [Pseudomonas sp. Pc102]